VGGDKLGGNMAAPAVPRNKKKQTAAGAEMSGACAGARDGGVPALLRHLL